jgi:hypothetical protein
MSASFFASGRWEEEDSPTGDWDFTVFTVYLLFISVDFLSDLPRHDTVKNRPFQGSPEPTKS